MKRKILLNLIFVILFVVFLILSFIIDFFFFIPIICILPFSFKSKKFESLNFKTDESKLVSNKDLDTRSCPRCGGEIALNGIKFCCHCGAKLNDN
ncbi:MAG: hypothetical protein ACFFHD_04350 [Promethearchaeota archaeon]